MKQILRLIVAAILIAVFPAMEISAGQKNKKELKKLEKEYAQAVQAYAQLIKEGAPNAALQRKGEDLAIIEMAIIQLGGTLDQSAVNTLIEAVEYYNKSVKNTDNSSPDFQEEDVSIATQQTTSKTTRSNPNEEITLTVSSDGQTKEDALKNALRTAIEQAYGAFVSANTTILNDELVKDEIVTVSNGSIKEYKEISSFEKPDGSGYIITVNATVSLPHLITYAKSHGSECEFAGNTFGMELKLFNLQKENELKVLYSMIPVIENLAKTTTKWELNIKEPSLARVEIEDGRYIYLSSSSDISAYYSYPDSIFSNCMDIMNLITNNPNGICALEMYIEFRDVNNTIYKYMEGILERIALDDQTASKYSNMGISLQGLTNIDDIGLLFRDKPNSFNKYILRSSLEDLNIWVCKIKSAIDKSRFNFTILDNTGQISDAHFYELSQLRNDKKYDGGENIYSISDDDMKFQIKTGRSIFEPTFDPIFYGIEGDGLFRFPFMMRLGSAYINCQHATYDEVGFGTYRSPENRYLLLATIFVPISEISKYSSFKVIPKEQ